MSLKLKGKSLEAKKLWVQERKELRVVIGNLLATKPTENVLGVHLYIMGGHSQERAELFIALSFLAGHHQGNKTAIGRSLMDWLPRILEAFGTMLQMQANKIS